MHKNFTILLLAVFMLVFLGSVAVFADYGPGAWEQKTRSSNTVEELSGPLGCSPMFLVTPTTATNSTLFLQNIAGDLYLTDNAFYSSSSAWTATIAANKSMALAFDIANGTFKFNYAAAGATPSFSTVASISSAGAMSMASLTLTGALSVEGNTDLGNAATDTISLTGVVDTDLTFVKEVNRAITVATSTTTSTAGANLTISAATGAASSVGGNTAITGGAAGAGSTAGTLSLGATNTSAITVGATGITTTNAGALTSTQTLTATAALVANGDVDLGNAATDTVTITGVIDGDVSFLKEVARTIKVATSTTTDTSGAALTIEAGDGVGTGGGGNLVLRAGNAGAGTDGILQLGVTDTSAISIGTSGITTTNAGPLTSSETLTATAAFVANGDVDLGNAATDTVTITGVIDADVAFIKEVARSLGIAASTTTNAAGAAMTIYAADADGNGAGGNMVVRAGNSPSGTDGVLQLGVTNTSAITLGASAITTTSTGPLTASETLTATSAFVANGDVDLGNAATDTVTVTGAVDSDISFLKEVNRTISIATSTTTDTVGASLTVAAADGVGTGNGGNMVVRAGNGAADGILQLGVTNTSAITLGASAITTTSTGPLTVTETMTANGNIDLGSDATDTLSLTATVDTDVIFSKEVNRSMTVAASTTAATAGANFSIAAAQGSTSGAGGNAAVTAGAGGDTGAGGVASLVGGAGGATSGTGGAVAVTGGAGTNGDASGGTVTIRGGLKNGAGTSGAVNIGDANTSAVGLGATGITTTNAGALTVSEAFTANGTTDIGNAATDTCTITAVVDSDVTFIKEVNRTVSPAQSTTTNAAGANLTVAAAAADGNGAGGTLALNAGDSPSGTDGTITVGAANTSAVTITPATNVVGNLSVNTNKFAVTAATGNTSIAGDINVAGAVRYAKMNRIFEFDEGANLLAASAMNYWWTLGGTAGTAAIVADENGIMQLSTTATGSRSATLTHTSANFNTNNAPEFIAYVQVSNITNSKVDLGWYVDANDELIFRFDTDVDAGNIYLVSENNNGGEVVTDTGVNLTAGTYFKFRLKINADETFTAEINDAVVAAGHVGTIRQLATFKPWFYIDNKAAAEEKLMNIDYTFLSQDR